MPKFAFNSAFVPVSVYFVENCLKDVSGGFLKVYLYALGLAAKGLEVETQTIADELNMLQSDVLQAFSYWKNEGLIIEDGGVMEFLTSPQSEELFPVFESPSQSTTEDTGYSDIDIASLISRDSNLAEMLQVAEELLARPLSEQDTQTLYWIRDNLGFSVEAVLLLLDYCISKDKKHMKYIEKTAIAWHAEGIVTPDEIMEHLANEEEKNTIIYKLRKAMGIADRPLSAPEESFFKKWCEEFLIPEDMIILAYEICLLNTSKLSFPYMDKIIERWHSEGIKTRQQAEEDNQKYKQKATGTKEIYKDQFPHKDLEKLTRNN